ncbi:HAMP domain-containing sensor histidine kinase [Hyphomonas sp.]|jgi:signal transduction histidine kinase|uniref:sensor histidine kinase n=1 Tax=Hyphomonas sp. TaxID=87 RepID=UPI0025BD1D99|nr:HAMP domain-containing sensor histidine kinase [Hyphomonas sp.]
MAKQEKSFLSYVTGNALPRETAVDRLILLQQHMDFSRHKLVMALIMLVNTIGASFLVHRWVPNTNIEVWITINLGLALLLVIDYLLKRGRPAPKQVSGKYLRRSEFLAIAFGLAWGSLPFFVGPDENAAMIMGGLMITPMSAGMASMLTRVPRIVLRYAIAAFVAGAAYSAFYQSVTGATICAMMIFFKFALYLGARSSYLVYRSDIDATIKAEESRDLLIGALEASHQAFAIFSEAGDVIVENQLHQKVFSSREDSLEPVDKPIRRDGVYWQKSVEHITGVGTVVVYTDVTRMEEVRFEIENARNEAEAANEAKTRFLASMSAELKVPLDVISACAGVIGSSSNIPCNEEEVSTYADKIGEQAMILSSTLDGIINFTRMERDDYLAQSSEVSVSEVINNVVRKFTEGEYARFADRLKVSVPQNLSADMDENSFEIIVRNIIKNALEAGSSAPIVVKAGMVSGVGLVVMVRDRGRGMTQDVLERAFEPFFHSRPAHQKYDHSTGVGLGLSVARRLADAQGLRIKLRSEPGRGTTAFITVPETLVRRAVPQDKTDAVDVAVNDLPELQKKTG